MGKQLKTIVFASLAVMVLASCPAQADFARRLSYQGRLVNSDGVPLANGSYDMTFKLYTVSTGGSSVWSEDHTAGNGNPVTVDNGLFSVVLGGIASLSGINFNSTEYYIEVVVSATTYSPRQRLTAAPFALNVPDGLITSTKMADGAALAEIIDDDGAGSGLDCDLLDGYDWSSIPNLADKWVDETGDTMAGTLNMGNNAIINIDWSSSDDGSGSGLDADLLDGVDSASFFNLGENETVTGTPSFNGGTSGTTPPFNVDSTFVVTNLNADLLDGYSAAAFQLRVTGTCAAGSAISTINADGTVACETDDNTTDHGALGGLGDDDHTQYFALAQNETVTGIPALNGGTSGVSAPFSVDSTFIVTNLNADLLDGYTTGNASGNIPLSNGTLNTNLNADLLDGYHAADLEAVLDHGQLQGLGDDDHTQYFALAQNETVTGIPALNGGTSGVSAPFTVDSNYIVTNLNADLLDGYDWTNVPNATDIWVNESGDTMTGELITPALRVPASGYSSGAALDAGDVGVDYPGNSGWAATWNSNILLSGLNSSSISFHDSGHSVATFRYTNNNFYLGENVTWGVSNLNVGGDVVVSGSDVYLTDGNTRLTEGSGNALRMQTDSGYVDMGPMNTGWAHFQTDRPSFYFNPKITVNGNVEPYTNNANTLGTSALRWNNAYLTTLNVTSTSLVSNLNADYVDGYHAQQLGNFGQWENHGTYNDCNANPNYWGWNFVQGTANCPNGTSSQWYRGNFSLGASYPMRGGGGYSLEVAYPRSNHLTAGVWMRTVENGGIGGWTRIDGNGACEIKSFSVGATTWCSAGKAVVAAMNTGRQLVNPESLSGAPTNGYMVCCASSVFP